LISDSGSPELDSICRGGRGAAGPRQHLPRPRKCSYALTGCGATNDAFCRSMALTPPLRQLSAMDADMGSGKMSSSSCSTPSKMPRATASGEDFGISKPRSYRCRWGRSAQPEHARLSRQERAQRLSHIECRRLRDRVSRSERKGGKGHGRHVVDDRSPRTYQQRQKRLIIAYGPKKFTASCWSIAARSLRSP